MSRKGTLINVENTRFIYKTNFAGDPEKDKYRSTKRYGNLVIPDIEQARDLIDAGFNVKLTKPKEGEEEGFIPTYFVKILLNMDSEWPPKVYLISGDEEPVLLEGDSVKTLDRIYVRNVNAVLNPYDYADGRSLYVQKLYVEQEIDSDPFAARYFGRGPRREETTEELPFA